ncbi:MAG: hypothetical protein MJ180_01275 [Candidatus Gastranaerophilales bacterium]|nr:hypothetical protein [Candidatus Gastranaerophilales bacterium]
MQVNGIKSTNNNIRFNGLLNNKLLVKGIEMASDNGVLFCSAASLVLSTLVRPLAIMATPNVEKENKQYACAKSIASSIIGLGITALISMPVVSAIRNIEKEPHKFLTDKAIKTFKNNSENLAKSSPFKFTTQFFKLGSGVLTVVPKTFLTCALIPPVMAFLFNQNKKKQEQLTFKGITPKPNLYQRFTNKLSGIFAKVFNTEKMQKFSSKYHDTSLAQHMFSANDVLATGLFIHFTNNNKHIKENRKKTLIYNSAIATGITVAGGYLINWLLKKPTEMFIKAFEKANKGLPNLPKYTEGIKNAKAGLILGGMYYLVTPIVATMMAEYMTNKNRN